MMMMIFVNIHLYLQGNGFISVVSSVAIVMTLCCISVDRYIAVTSPTRYKSIVTVKRACYALIVVWGQGLLYASFPLSGWSKYEYHRGTLHCSPSWTSDCSLYIFLAVVGFGIPIALMVFTYIRIFFVIRKHARKVSTVRRARNVAKKTSTCKLISVTQRQSANPNLNLNPNAEINDKLSNSAEKISHSENEQTIFSSNMELSSYDSCAKQVELNTKTTGKQSWLFVQAGDECVISNELATENTCSDSSSTGQRCKRGTMRVGQVLSRYFPRKPRGHNRRPLSREYKVAKTGVLLLILFVVLWLPYMVVHICSARFKAPQFVVRFSMWLVFMNGVLNPIAYAFGNSTVKLKFEQMFSTVFALCCKCRRKERERPNLRISETI